MPSRDWDEVKKKIRERAALRRKITNAAKKVERAHQEKLDAEKALYDLDQEAGNTVKGDSLWGRTS